MKPFLINKFSFGSLCLIGCLSVSSSAISEQPQAFDGSVTVADLAASIERRFDDYAGLEFEYHVLTHATPSPKATPRA